MIGGEIFHSLQRFVAFSDEAARTFFDGLAWQVEEVAQTPRLSCAHGVGTPVQLPGSVTGPIHLHPGCVLQTLSVNGAQGRDGPVH